MSDRFEITAGPEGVLVLTLTREEAEMVLEDLKERLALTPAIWPMIASLEEWLT